jgi:hypothetical protein
MPPTAPPTPPVLIPPVPIEVLPTLSETPRPPTLALMGPASAGVQSAVVRHKVVNPERINEFVREKFVTSFREFMVASPLKPSNPGPSQGFN